MLHIDSSEQVFALADYEKLGSAGQDRGRLRLLRAAAANAQVLGTDARGGRDGAVGAAHDTRRSDERLLAADAGDARDRSFHDQS